MSVSPDPAASGAHPSAAELAAGYRRLGAVLTTLLRERGVGAVLERIPGVLGELVPADDIVLWESRDGELVPLLAYGSDAELMLTLRVRIGEGITGLAAASRTLVCSNDAHRDPRARQVPGTPLEPESILCAPLVVKDLLLGALSLYRSGEGRPFTQDELELTQHVADVAAIAIDNARTQAELAELAQTDDLTGLANRRRFREELQRTLFACERAGFTVSLLLLDLDGFKLVNDCHGHDEGDAVLGLVAGCLNEHTRGGDLVARLGGDEFAVLLPHTGVRDAEALADRVTRAIRAARTGISASVGVASTERGGVSDLLGEADRLLLEAKRRRGRPSKVAHDEYTKATEGDRAAPARQIRGDGFEPSFVWLGPV